MHPKEILITGGAGFLAATLSKCLRRDEISACLLDVAECPGWARKAGLKYLRGDVRDPTAVMAALEDADAVVHTAFAPPYQSSESIRSVNVDGTRNLCACALTRGVGRVVLISSTIVLKPPRV